MKSLSEIKKIREDKLKELDLRVNKEAKTEKKHILVCRGTGCTSSKSAKIIEQLNEEIKDKGLTNVEVVRTGCFGLCAKGPIVIVSPENTFYEKVKPEDAKEIIDEHIINKKVVERLLCNDEDTETINSSLDKLAFYKKQDRIALANCGRIDPEKIDEYIAFDGYKAIEKILFGTDGNSPMSSDEVVDEVVSSGLRGRGGAGFPTGMKWNFAKKAEGDFKYVICNADEGDPGAFMDRSILEGDPHCVIEAMMIAGYAIGAGKGYVYVRAEYPIAVQRLQIAIDQAKEYGILGDKVLGSDFSFDLEIRLGAGAFICGEETALLESIEGRRGQPRTKPPFPANEGLFGKPTLINNVETYANITKIILNGGKWFSGIGTEKSKGTKVFALGGNVKNIGLVEVPMGVTIREIVEEIGGGVPNGRKIKAVQTGGPSGGCISEENFDTPIDYDNLTAIGAMMGSGGMIVLDDSNCMVDIAKFYLEFTVDESCGKCTACRIGTKRLYEMLEKITSGKGTLEDLDKMEKLCNDIKVNSLCALGQTAPNPVLSTMKYFKDEYIEHVVNKRCPAGVCKAMLSYEINTEKCIGCTMCAKVCPADAITGKVKEKHVIDKEKCIKCGACIEKCKFNAIEKK